MRYLSTRGSPERPGFAQVLLGGLAADGGLFVPEEWPEVGDEPFDTYPGLVAATLAPYIEPDDLASELPALIGEAYSGFRHEEVAPLVEVGDGHFILELFWGPTLSFKDYALQVVGWLFETELRRQKRQLLVLGATSGDTGSAAMAACRGRENIQVVILYPEGKISEVQRRQMTAIEDANVQAVAVEGTFDDCQALVKRAFVDDLDVPLGAINSINWARIAVQASYYLWAAAAVGSPVAFAVPTGNFGNVFSGYAATRMGAKIDRFIVANNRNHGLTGLIRTGRLEVEAVHSTLAPAMDIQIPSNLERYLFEIAERDGDRVRHWQSQLADGRLQLSPGEHARLGEGLEAGWLSDDQVIEVMRRVHAHNGLLLDPHTAIAWEVGERLRPSGMNLVTVATAHPSKFGDAVMAAIGQTPDLPDELAVLFDLPERVTTIPNDYSALVRLLRTM
ncbi:MAG TPA: threonine synthase [Acidimicrobiia bacterium]|nr:threonine synthase [Acidimicrobiia bacterium]